MTPSDVEEQIHQQGCSPETYFKRAMMWQYHQPHDTYLDYLKYNIHYIVPQYVQNYTNHLQQAALRRVEDEIIDDMRLAEIGRGD